MNIQKDTRMCNISDPVHIVTDDNRTENEILKRDNESQKYTEQFFYDIQRYKQFVKNKNRQMLSILNTTISCRNLNQIQRAQKGME